MHIHEKTRHWPGQPVMRRQHSFLSVKGAHGVQLRSSRVDAPVAPTETVVLLLPLPHETAPIQWPATCAIARHSACVLSFLRRQLYQLNPNSACVIGLCSLCWVVGTPSWYPHHSRRLQPPRARHFTPPTPPNTLDRDRPGPNTDQT